MPKEEIKTPEQIQRGISAAMDSVTLINERITEIPATEKSKKIVKANVQHLELMLTQDWFEGGLDAAKRTSIDSAISTGNTYSA
jgi:hypothetical protein